MLKSGYKMKYENGTEIVFYFLKIEEYIFVK